MLSFSNPFNLLIIFISNIPYTIPPCFYIKWIAALSVPPVARTSSTIITLSPGLNECLEIYKTNTFEFQSHQSHILNYICDL